MTLEEQLKAYARAVDARLGELLPTDSDRPSQLTSAMRYACLGPGKRLRPALCLASCEAVGGSFEDAIDAACALEMIHSFSLVHDDLPALDDDELRRGRPTCHVVYGEAIAILAGDGLFSLAFETLSFQPRSRVSSDRKLRALQTLALATGLQGLVAGEAADIVSEGLSIDLELLEFIHNRKTGALMRASCEIGALLGTDHADEIRLLREYGSAVGLAFQIADDVLDETSTSEQLGKTAGNDREKEKATFPRLMGIEASRERARALAAHASEILQGLSGPTGFLEALAHFSVHRAK